MTTNTYAPFGLRIARRMDGAAPNYAIVQHQIAATNTAVIAYGDPVVQNSSGYIDKYTAGGSSIYGIFEGCSYLSTSSGRTTFSNQWPGSGANTAAPVNCKINTDKVAIYQAQIHGTVVAQTSIGLNIDIETGTSGTPNAAGFSQCGLVSSSIATTSTLPFRIVGIVQTPAINASYDPAGDNNVVEVIMNAFQPFSTTGI